MRQLRIYLWSLLVLVPLGFVLARADVPAAPPNIVLLEVDGPIVPVTSDYIRRGLKQAAGRNAALVVLRLNTPGGVYTTTRRITQDILGSPVPVAVYVAPSGAHAASAGTYILLSAHIAAMAPATNIGSATPVAMGGTPGAQPPADDKSKADDARRKSEMEEKVLNDAVAYIKGLAQAHGRNAAWAERAVREAANLTADEAVRERVADFVATDVAELLNKADGRKVTLNGNLVTLKTAAGAVTAIAPDWRNRLLSVIADPSIFYFLMTLGFIGLLAELWNPGYVLPGVIGAICLLLALYAAQVLPVSYAGVALILLGIGFMVAEAFAPSFGALGIGGVIAFVLGSIMLFDGEAGEFTLAWPLIAAMTLVSAGFFLGILGLALKSRQRAVVSGAEEMIGARGEALEKFSRSGRVRVHSEEWQARTSTPIARGARVKVTRRDGLILWVEPDNDEDD